MKCYLMNQNKKITYMEYDEDSNTISHIYEIINIDYMSGLIQIAYIDANDKTPILDIKPYTPSLDRVENPQVPDWCSHWPHSLEESASFAWENEFNF